MKPFSFSLILFSCVVLFGCEQYEEASVDQVRENVESLSQEENIASIKKEGTEEASQQREQVVKKPVSSEKYMDYSLDNESALRERVDYGLFFTSENCDNCQELEEGLMAHSEDLPSGTRILKVDFDNQMKLKQKYEVTVPHTLIFIDSAGEFRDRIEGVDLNMIKRLFSQ